MSRCSPVRIAAFAVLALAGAAVVNAWSQAVAPLYPRAQARAQALQAQAADVRAVTVGHSHNKAINFEALGLPTGYHYWTGGADLFEAAQTADCLARRLPNLDVVLMPVAYLGPIHDNHAMAGGQTRRIRHYLELSSLCDARPVHGLTWTWLRSFAAHVPRPDRGKGLVLALLKRLASPERRSSGVEAPERGYLGPPPDLLHAPAAPPPDSSALRHLRAARSVRARQWEQNADRAARTLARLHTTLRQRGVRLVLYTPPYDPLYTRTYQRTAPHVLALFHRTLRAAAALADIEYHNFARYMPLARDSTLFWDASHMNTRGARAFSAVLRTAMDRAMDQAHAPASAGTTPADD
jgi:hypothetical protein